MRSGHCDPVAQAGKGGGDLEQLFVPGDSLAAGWRPGLELTAAPVRAGSVMKASVVSPGRCDSGQADLACGSTSVLRVPPAMPAASQTARDRDRPGKWPAG
jgi:hypothetical protein